MALSCLGSGGSDEALTITDSTALDLPSTGWLISLMFYPDSTIGINTFAYMYAHGTPNNDGNDGIAILINNTGFARVIITDTFGVQFDFTSSNAIVADEWNHIGISFPPGNLLRMHLNGVMTTDTTTFSLGYLNPPGNARIGDATHASPREFNGRIAHVSKWNRSFSIGDVNHFTALLISPEFAQTDHIWHIPIWNASFNGDQLNTVTTVPDNALYGNHAPAQYPGDPTYVVPPPPVIPTNLQQQRVVWSMA
jgi:hypothetical protein